MNNILPQHRSHTLRRIAIVVGVAALVSLVTVVVAAALMIAAIGHAFAQILSGLSF